MMGGRCRKMLHIILLIFKIIGIILLVLLGILLLVLLTILLVPVRYRIAIEHGDTFRMEGRVYWLLHLIHAKISYLEGNPHIRVRVFGFVIYDNLRPKTTKIKIKKHKSSVKKEDKHKNKQKAVTDHKKDKEFINEHKTDTIRSVQIQKQADKNESDSEKQAVDVTPDFNRIDTSYKVSEHQKNTKKEKTFFLKKILFKIKSFKEKVCTFFKELKNKIIKIFEAVVNIKQKIGLISNFIKNELNREGFQITYSSLKKLLKHILPTKLKSKLIFGTGDPCTTGQVLGLMGILYSFYGDKIQIIPDFENSRFEGKHDARGRIRLITVLIIVIKLIFDKRFKQLKTNFIILKEAL
jgi:hypothetical protein